MLLAPETWCDPVQEAAVAPESPAPHCPEGNAGPCSQLAWVTRSRCMFGHKHACSASGADPATMSRLVATLMDSKDQVEVRPASQATGRTAFTHHKAIMPDMRRISACQYGHPASVKPVRTALQSGLTEQGCCQSNRVQAWESLLRSSATCCHKLLVREGTLRSQLQQL